MFICCVLHDELCCLSCVTLCGIQLVREGCIEEEPEMS